MALSFAEPGYEPPHVLSIERQDLDKIDSIVVVETCKVRLGERLRPIDPVWAGALGQIMARDGQRKPIDICRVGDSDEWELAGPGGHRLVGAQMVGIEYLKAVVCSADRDERLAREITEELQRQDLDPIDRAAFVAAHVALLKRRAGITPEKDGRAASANARWQKALREEATDANVTMTNAYGFADEVAEQLGWSRSTVERDLVLYRRLSPSLIPHLRRDRRDLAGNATQLRALAKLEPSKQAFVVELLCRPADRAKSVSDALAKIGGSNMVGDPEAKRLATFVGTFGRMGLTEKKGALNELAALLPAGFRIVFDGGEA